MCADSRIHNAAGDTGPPHARTRCRPTRLHGNEYSDEFAYLRRPGDPDTRSYLADESRYFEVCMRPVQPLRDKLYQELKGRLLENDVSVPEVIDGWRYYTRVEAGRQYPVHCRARLDGDACEEVYLDENLLADGSDYCDVAVMSICPGSGGVACAVDRTGEELYEILVAPAFGDELVLRASGAGDSIAWSRNGKCLVYTSADEHARPDTAWVYDLESDRHLRLFVEPDPAFHVSVWSSRSGRWIFIDTAGNCSSETRVLPSEEPLTEPTVVIPRRKEIEYTVDHHEDGFLVLINDRGENFRLIALPEDLDNPGEVVELIASRDDVSLEFIDAYRDHVLLGERGGGVANICVWDSSSGSKRYLPGAGEGAYLDVEDLYDYEARFIRCEYSTPVVPHTVYDYDTATGEVVRRKTSTPPDYRESDYVTECLNVPSQGVVVPVTLVAHRDTWQRRGPQTPLLLRGYGAYEEVIETDFDSDLVSLLDRGVIAATAHVRGGGELGPGWHDGGRLANKENSFTDLLACARYLVEHGYTGTGRIAAWGASAGGLLVAVAAQRQPELFASVVLEVPFLDVLNTLLDPGLPLTEYDYDEFGNPSVEEEFEWIRGYSPYDNVSAQAYPPMLVTAALNDQRVGYWEALKWVARLRANKTDSNPLLLRIDATGHLGESGRYGTLKDAAGIFAFLIDMWGIES